MTLRTVIFDLDGVLIDSEPLIRFAFEEAYRQVVGNDAAPIEEYLQYMGEPFPKIMGYLGLPNALWEPYLLLWQQHINRVQIFPAARELLEWARSRGFQLAILTGKERARTDLILAHLNIEQFFDVVMTSDQVDHPKPDPEGIRLILRTLNCPAEAAVMIGDAVSDVLCAQNANVRAIAVTWGIKPERIRTLCSADYYVRSFQELQSVLGQISFGIESQ
jgi:3-amino-5-hydroxybenzoic acid synthesis related protein